MRASRHDLPTEVTTFVGREREIAEVKRLLAETRLLTLTGAGGIGKSRLARQVAASVLEEYQDGVRWVDLSALSDQTLVADTVAAALGVPERAGRSVTTTLSEFVRARKMLLVLDNCEHLLAGSAALAEALLRASSHLKILATSREAVGIAGETRWRVPSLTLPDPQRSRAVDHLPESEAVRLFCARARAADTDFSMTRHSAPAVAHICIRLDGMPLAIELAARWVRALTVDQIAARLDDRFRLLVGRDDSSMPRHRTLRATMDWSYGLLSPPAQILLRRFAVFAGGATLEAAEAICTASGVPAPQLLDVLSELVDKSVLLFDREGPQARYRMLETVREYAWERLREAGEEAETCRRHREWCLGLAERADAAIRGPSQVAWLDRLDAEHDNLRSALEWSRKDDCGAETELRLAGMLHWFWVMRGHWSEARNRLEGALMRSDGAPRSALPRALLGGGNLAILQGDLDGAERMLERCLAVSREVEDTERAALALMRLATIAQRRGHKDKATVFHDEALAMARAAGDQWLTGLALRHAGLLAWHRGEYDQATSYFTDSLAVSRTIGDTRHSGDCLRHLGLVALHRAEYAQAAASYAEGLALCQEVGDRWNIEGCLEGAAHVACAAGRHAEAARLFGAAGVLFGILGFHRAPSDHALHQRSVAAVRAWLGDAAFEATSAEGREMPLDEAIAYAGAQLRLTVEKPAARGRDAAEAHPGLLTVREREIALLVTRGMTNQEIASRLFISERTVDAHVRHILEKLGARSRAQVAAWVGGHGLGRTLNR